MQPFELTDAEKANLDKTIGAIRTDMKADTVLMLAIRRDGLGAQTYTCYHGEQMPMANILKFMLDISIQHAYECGAMSVQQTMAKVAETLKV